jgi:hypothetical protein
MNRLEQILTDPASTPAERDMARQKLGGDPIHLEAELTSALGKPLMAVEYLRKRSSSTPFYPE